MPPVSPVPGRAHSLKIAATIGLALYCGGCCRAKHHPLGTAIRTAGLAILAYVAVQRRSITTWTLFAILAGTELGADAPGVAVHLHVLAEIFLRLVRVIVAPLILGTLTTGIAGHGRLRSLGRIAWKTFLYFEIVTTLALVVGAVAIHLSRAGEGIVLPASTAASDAAPALVTHPGVESFLLNVFPE